jgi:hypothetical protein
MVPGGRLRGRRGGLAPAEAFVFAAPSDPSVRDSRYWRDGAVTVLRCYLHAAALEGLDMRSVLRWA